MNWCKLCKKELPNEAMCNVDVICVDCKLTAAETELSALREDKARLDWLFVWIRAHWNQFPYKSRQAIDAARKENT